MTRHRGAHLRLNPVHRTDPKPESRIQAANTRPTRRLASDHGRDVRQDESSHQ